MTVTRGTQGNSVPRSPRPASASRTAARRPVPRSRIASFIMRGDDAMNARPLLDYTMIRTVVLVLTGLGVVMVMSSSMASSFATSSSVWSQAIRQTIMVTGGLFLFWVMLKISPERLRKLSHVIMAVSVCMLIAVLTPLGTGGAQVGSQSWLLIGPIGIQPSEFTRVAIAIWGAAILANKDYSRLTKLSNGFAPFIAVASLCLLLIGMQGDYGMAMSFAVVVALILIFAGISWRLIAVAVAISIAGLAVVFFGGGFRSNRFHVYFDALFGRFEDTRGIAFQSHQGFLSLADGSLFGVGLGQSRAKWFYLPEARNDFIFAIIGEELGLWGGALVIILFALLAFFGLRTARRAHNQFQALMAAALTAGVVSQAFVNIGYVLGLLPVTGIQLPMLSAGGTSAVITLGAMGILASIARHEPDSVSSMQNYGRPVFDRVFALNEPKAPSQLSQSRANRQSGPTRSRVDHEARFGAPVTARDVTQPNSASAYRRPPAEPSRNSARSPRSANSGSRYDDPRDSSSRGRRRVS